MKLLLTSAGIQNQSIAKALLELVGKSAEEINFVYVPTAANVEEGDKGWLIDNLMIFKDQGYASVDIVDISAVPKSVWLPRLEVADVICFGGGNENYLARVMKESGLREVLPELLKTRVYMGISAGSMVAGKFPPREVLELIYPQDTIEGELEQALGYVNLHFKPHLNSEYFTEVRKEKLESLKGIISPVYALDDQSALKIVDGNIEVVSEGEFLKI